MVSCAWKEIIGIIKRLILKNKITILIGDDHMFYVVLFLLVALFIVSIIVAIKSNIFDFVGVTVSIICGLILGVGLLAWFSSYYGYKDQISQYYITKQDLENRHEKFTELENAALTQKIIELNRGLASAKYWNQTFFDPFVPDEVMDLEYLK